jgi:hypothetical protein
LGETDLAAAIVECHNPAFDGDADSGIVRESDSTLAGALHFRNEEQGGVADTDVEPDAEWSARDHGTRDELADDEFGADVGPMQGSRGA